MVGAHTNAQRQLQQQHRQVMKGTAVNASEPSKSAACIAGANKAAAAAAALLLAAAAAVTQLHGWHRNLVDFVT